MSASNLTFHWNEDLDIFELDKLFKTCDWNLDFKGVKNSFKYSWKWLTCRKNDDLLGFVRILSDGFDHAYICSMIVSKKYHGIGIGSKMLEIITSELKTLNMNPLLLTREENAGFYEKSGYANLKPGVVALKNLK